MAYGEHQSEAQVLIVRCAVVTLSDTRDQSSDKSGARIQELLGAQGHQVVFYGIIRDEPAELDALLSELEARGDVDAILTNGGTGIAARDQTVPVIQRHLTTEIPGFGELFRMLSFDQVRSGAMLSRALGGIASGKLLFAMPGSTGAVELAMTKLILPELRHLVWELRR